MAGWLAMVAIMIAAVAPPSANARVHAYIVVDAQTGKVLEAHNADTLCYPASLAKLMTLYITFQELSSGKMTLAQEIPVSLHAADQPPMKLGLRPGERITVESAILAITTLSGNDAAVVLAEAIGGTETRFAQLENRTARELGLNHTTFCNASGLPNWRQKTTASDMAKLALAILHNFPEYYHFFDVRSFDFQGRTIYGHDHLLGRCAGVDGMKTGFTRASGYNIVTSAVRDGRRLVGVVMGGSTIWSRDRLMVSLINRGFSIDHGQTLTLAASKEAETGRAAVRYTKTSDEAGEPANVPSSRLGWFVQVGGNYRYPLPVRRALESALRTAPGPLKGARPLVVKVGGRWYRARFSNMSRSSAWEACRVLRERRFTCRVSHLRSSGIDLASAGR
ncbi:MAG: D-alanyl-D-alanine carboxypeptidase [Acidobacteria bacterium]|nr:D-alanyl-D-alanine carboxypeptidase [Acidobacteriota bacterium]